MSLQIAAQHLAAQGRGPDTTLVHMTPGEVKGLQAIAMAHGGSLTTNPQTGLPEAGFLSSILPMVAGIGLTALSGGTLSPLMAGLLTGGVTGVATGSLKKGLMAGLGAYGGAGLMGSVVGAGAAGASGAAAAEAAGAGAAEAAAQMTPTMGGVVPNFDPTTIGYDPAAFGTAGPASPEVQRLLNTYPAPAAPAASVVDPVTRMNMQVAPGVPTVTHSPYIAEPGTVLAPRTVPYEQMKAAGLSDAVIRQSAADYGSNVIGTAQGPAFSQATQQAAANPLSTGIKAIIEKPSTLFTKDNAKYGAAALAPMLFQEPKTAGSAPRDSEQYRYAYNPNRDMPPTREGDVGEFRYFNPSYTRLAADGGIMSAMPVQQMSDANNAEMLTLNRSQMYASGGISHLGDYSDGGRLLRGPGDGVSDDIPATIANKRPARLADGEFVVPARIVSELGNGSTDAGARKLYSMMDRVQKNRAKTVGKNKVAVNSRSEKLLPA
jgi:hypothetical protein